MIGGTLSSILDDLPIGMTTLSESRTITEGDLALMNTLIWATDEPPSTASGVSESYIPDRLLTGPGLIAVAVGLSRTSRVFQVVGSVTSMHLLITCSVAATYREPVHLGDTLTVETSLAGATLHPELDNVGTLLFHENAHKHSGSPVVEIQRRILFDRVAGGEPWDLNTCWSAVRRLRTDAAAPANPTIFS
jgi:hypothetical protein